MPATVFPPLSRRRFHRFKNGGGSQRVRAVQLLILDAKFRRNLTANSLPDSHRLPARGRWLTIFGEAGLWQE